MILNLPCHYYLASMGELANQNVSMARLLRPFHLPAATLEDPTLLLGLVLDVLAQEFRPNHSVDPFDIAAIAWELDFAPAGEFLDQGPYQIYHLLKEQRA